MNFLVTAGNTHTPVDRVRCITNIFSGRTGGRIAARAYERGHTVTLLTSYPEVVEAIPAVRPRGAPAWRVQPYRTFDELAAAMAQEITGGGFDVVVHAAAVSDYAVEGIFTHRAGRFEDASAAKVTGSHPELWLQLVPTPKLVDKIRTEWGFTGGILVKFKLEVGLPERDLLEVAERARVHSAADLMCANTLDGMHDWALIGAEAGGYRKVSRDELPDELLDAVESLRGT